MATPFHVLIFFEARPGKGEALGRILTELIAPTRAEHGCRYYEPFSDVEAPEKFTVIEGWDTPEQWQNHLKATHVAKALTQIKDEDLLTQPFKAQQLRSLA
jgi:quinol monooxygenase YgiN